MKKLNAVTPNTEIKRALRMLDIQHKTGLSKTHIYRLIKRGLFPKPFHLSERAIAFFESDIDNWLNARCNGIIE